MGRNVSDGLVLIALGLLLSFVGLVWVANLFGVADDHGRRIARSSGMRTIARWRGDDRRVADPKNPPGMKLGRYLAGIGFMAVGAIAVVGGIVSLLAG